MYIDAGCRLLDVACTKKFKQYSYRRTVHRAQLADADCGMC